MGILVDVCTYIFCNNKYVLCNTTILYSTLKKKSQIIAFRFIRGVEAIDEWRTAYVNTHDKPMDLLMKVFSIFEKQRRFFRCYSIICLFLCQRQLRLHIVGTLVSIKSSMTSTYAGGCRPWTMLLLVLGYGFHLV